MKDYQIKSIDIKKVHWGKTGYKYRTKYSRLYQRIRQMKLNRAIQVNLKVPHKLFPLALYGNFRKDRVSYKLTIRQLDATYKKWGIAKIKKRSSL